MFYAVLLWEEREYIKKKLKEKFWCQHTENKFNIRPRQHMIKNFSFDNIILNWICESQKNSVGYIALVWFVWQSQRGWKGKPLISQITIAWIPISLNHNFPNLFLNFNAVFEIMSCWNYFLCKTGKKSGNCEIRELRFG